MFAILKSLGTTPEEREALKIISSGLDIQVFNISSMSTGMLDGPTDLPVFSCDISVSISLHVAGKIKMILQAGLLNIPSGCWVHLVFHFLIFDQCWQNNY